MGHSDRPVGLSGSTDRRRQNLIPWKPGQSGNPLGTPQATREALAIYRDASPDAARKIVAIANDENEDMRWRMMALFHIQERALGKPKELKDVEETKSVVDLSRCTPEQLSKLKALMNEARATIGLPVDADVAAEDQARSGPPSTDIG